MVKRWTWLTNLFEIFSLAATPLESNTATERPLHAVSTMMGASPDLEFSTQLELYLCVTPLYFWMPSSRCRTVQLCPAKFTILGGICILTTTSTDGSSNGTNVPPIELWRIPWKWSERSSHFNSKHTKGSIIGLFHLNKIFFSVLRKFIHWGTLIVRAKSPHQRSLGGREEQQGGFL